MKKIAILGIGTAGIQSLCHFLTFLDESKYQVFSISDPKIPILGIGESTNPTFAAAIEWGLKFSFLEDLKELNGTFKLGTFLKNWRTHNFLNPFLAGGMSLHFDTHSLSSFAIDRFQKIWKNKFKQILGSVGEVKNINDGVSVIIDNKEYFFDYVIDCTGFPKDLNDYYISDLDTVNSCIVYNDFEETNKPWNYTLAQATEDGWMFGVPLATRTSFGYLFDDKLTSKEEALHNFSKTINHKLDLKNVAEFKFCPYYAKSICNGRIFKNGNKLAFFEPLYGNSQQLYFLANQLIFDLITNDNNPNFLKENNESFFKLVNSIVGILNYSYHGGSVFKTPFWKKVTEKSTKSLHENVLFKEAIRLAAEIRHQNRLTEKLEFYFLEHSLKLIDSDTHFGYNYFN